MSKIREHVRRTLDAREPTPTEAREDFERILRKIEHPPASRLWRIAPPLAGLAVAAGVAIVLLRQPTHPGPIPSPAPTVPLETIPPPEASAKSAGGAIEIYVRRSGEPESAAVSVTLNSRGER